MKLGGQDEGTECVKYELEGKKSIYCAHVNRPKRKYVQKAKRI